MLTAVKKILTDNHKLLLLPIMKNVLYNLQNVSNLTELSLNHLSIVMTLLKNYSLNHNIAFIYSKKINKDILKEQWEGYVDIIHELNVPYTKILLQNLQHQAPNSQFNTTDDEFKLQKKIYGYFLLVDKTYNNFGFNASYFFTNSNTCNFFSTNIASLDNEYFNILASKLINKEITHCIVGEAAVKLLKNNTEKTIVNTELWDLRTKITSGYNYDTYEYNTTKVEWFNECFMIPRHVKKIVNNSSTEIKEKIICYYKGLKFLYITSDYSNIELFNSKIPKNLSVKKCYKKNKTKITNVWKDVDDKISIYKNHPITSMTKFTKGFWILRPNGNFDIIISKIMYIPFLSYPFVATGTFTCNDVNLKMLSANKFSNNSNSLLLMMCKSRNINLTFENYKPKPNNKLKNNRRVKRKIYNINERQRNNISIFSPLLS